MQCTHTLGIMTAEKTFDKKSIHLLFKLPNSRSKFTYHSHWYNLNWVPIFPISKKGFFIYWDRVVFTVTRRLYHDICIYLGRFQVYTYQLRLSCQWMIHDLSTYAWHINEIKFVWSPLFFRTFERKFQSLNCHDQTERNTQTIYFDIGHQVYN